MAKLLNKEEAVEIINTLHDEYGLDRPFLTWEEEYGNAWWVLYKSVTKSTKFFVWNWTRKVPDSSSWERASTLEDLITAVEYNMARLDPRVEKATRIRERHATRILDVKLEE